jgi:hypothetical protein
MDDLHEKIDAILARIQDDLPDGCGEMSEFAGGMQEAANSAYSLIARARSEIAGLFEDEKEHGTNA